jgi:hypothetical protein
LLDMLALKDMLANLALRVYLALLS